MYFYYKLSLLVLCYLTTITALQAVGYEEYNSPTDNLEINNQQSPEELEMRKTVLEELLAETNAELRRIAGDNKKPIKIEQRYVGRPPSQPRPTKKKKSSTRGFDDEENSEAVKKLEGILQQLEEQERKLQETTTRITDDTTTETTTPTTHTTTDNIDTEVKQNAVYNRLVELDNELESMLSSLRHTDDDEMEKRRGRNWRSGGYPKRSEGSIGEEHKNTKLLKSLVQRMKDAS